MIESSARLLRLLGVLQGGRELSGVELAARLGVTSRTVRRDVDKLRALGYRIGSRLGADGGYRLAPGVVLPPLMLDEDDALALAVSLRTAAALGLAGLEDAAVQALAKVEQLYPPRLGTLARAVAQAVSGPTAHGPQVEVEVLTKMAAAIRDHRQLRLLYRSHDGTESRRSVEPHHVVASGTRWYLLAFDVDRNDWRQG